MSVTAIVVPWVNVDQRIQWLTQWGMQDEPVVRQIGASDILNIDHSVCVVMQHDVQHAGCGVTKNEGIDTAVAIVNAETVIVLDDDCYPSPESWSLTALARMHERALTSQKVQMFETVTDPPSRGTPYAEHCVRMPVAASMGFWTYIGDYCAVRQLVHGAKKEMEFQRSSIFGRYFPLCGMNLAFKPKEWWPWCSFIDVPRFDDIWMGWLWQREAYRRGYCFNLNGPCVRHARQSNVWKNLREEAKHLEASETLWREIMTHEREDYDSLRALLPV